MTVSLFYKFGSLTVQTDDYFYPDEKKHLAFYETEPTENPEVTFIVHKNCKDISVPPGEQIAIVNKRRWYRLENGYAFADIIEEFSENQIFNLMIADEGFRRIEVWLCPSELLMLNKDSRPYHMLQEILRYALLFHNGTVIHASSLAYDGKGLLFSAPSGTGKSTHTGLWKKYVPGVEIVNDDMPFIFMKNGTPYLCGAPWSGKNSIHKNLSVPLSALVFIERSPRCLLTPMAPSEAVWKLFEAVRKPVVPDLAEKNLDIIAAIIEAVPAYRLQCDMSFEAVQTSMQALS